MTRPRGRPARGEGVTRDAILSAALALLDEDGAGFGMRALAARLGVTPMSLYHHVGDRAGLLRALSDQVYGGVLNGAAAADGIAELRALLTRYHDAVARHLIAESQLEQVAGSALQSSIASFATAGHVITTATTNTAGYTLWGFKR